MEKRNSHAIKVTFVTPPYNDMKKVYYFGSLKDVFCEFSPEQVDTRLNRLWNFHKVSKGEKVFTDKCSIEKISITHYLHKSKNENTQDTSTN